MNHFPAVEKRHITRGPLKLNVYKSKIWSEHDKDHDGNIIATRTMHKESRGSGFNKIRTITTMNGLYAAGVQGFRDEHSPKQAQSHAHVSGVTPAPHDDPPQHHQVSDSSQQHDKPHVPSSDAHAHVSTQQSQGRVHVDGGIDAHAQGNNRRVHEDLVNASIQARPVQTERSTQSSYLSSEHHSVHGGSDHHSPYSSSGNTSISDYSPHYTSDSYTSIPDAPAQLPYSSTLGPRKIPTVLPMRYVPHTSESQSSSSLHGTSEWQYPSHNGGWPRHGGSGTPSTGDKVYSIAGRMGHWASDRFEGSLHATGRIVAAAGVPVNAALAATGEGVRSAGILGASVSEAAAQVAMPVAQGAGEVVQSFIPGGGMRQQAYV